MQWLGRKRQLNFESYESLWQWSVDQPADFWAALWDYFEIDSPTPPEAILSDGPMPFYNWFEGSKLNYAHELIRRAYSTERPAMLFASERHTLHHISWQQVKAAAGSIQHHLKLHGLKPGDRVAAYLPNIPEAAIAFLATASAGGVWTSVSPDFGTSSVIDRFQLIEPKVLIAVDGYSYGGKLFDKTADLQAIRQALPTLELVIVVPYLHTESPQSSVPNAELWPNLLQKPAELLTEMLPASHPLWILYSSGTTGAPKAITHSHGGILLEHLKYIHFHNNVMPGQNFFWYTTTGWMMWNFLIGSWLAGATLVVYDGSPGYPDMSRLWQLAEQAPIHHFGTSAPFIMATLKAGIQPGTSYKLDALVSIGSTGSPLPPEGFEFVYRSIHPNVWLCSMSGGTDVCSAFVGGNPLKPVYAGEIQCRALGCKLEAWDDNGHPQLDTMGEMIISQPMPSMPIGFWGDEGHKRYLESYFEMYPNAWRHGDWITVTPHGSVVIHGRSDATLNPQGIRIGTAEIYRALDTITEIRDSLVVNLDYDNGNQYMPLFVVLAPGHTLSTELQQRIARTIRQSYTPRHVPDTIVVIAEVPYTLSGKKMEAPVKRILQGAEPARVAKSDAMRNPASLQFFVDYRRQLPPH